ncbi:MAG: V-type ATP synthase subunit D [Spirochaetia bacterium]
MANIKLTKNELKKQKDALKRYERYLPTLVLKKQQLQMVIRQVEAQERQKRHEKEAVKTKIDRWVAVFGEPASLDELLGVEEVVTEIGNIAGVDIPVFKDIRFWETEYDLFETPLWVDTAIEELKKLVALEEESRILREQAELLNQELRITSQRVNLFEKVKIPETRENIRTIQIYLGDQQTAAVVRGKIAKKKLVEAESK